MPLQKTASRTGIGRNISEMEASGHPRSQSIAAALRVADEAKKRARGGAVETHPGGLLASHVAGRTDHLPLNVKAGSYVIPADVVSGLGEGNSLAGKNVLSQMFGGGKQAMPYTPAHRARGGAVPIMAAGGEYIITPEQVKKKFGNMDHGHKVLDTFVKNARAKNIKTLKNLPGPAKGHEKE